MLRREPDQRSSRESDPLLPSHHREEINVSIRPSITEKSRVKHQAYKQCLKLIEDEQARQQKIKIAAEGSLLTLNILLLISAGLLLKTKLHACEKVAELYNNHSASWIVNPIGNDTGTPCGTKYPLNSLCFAPHKNYYGNQLAWACNKVATVICFSQNQNKTILWNEYNNTVIGNSTCGQLFPLTFLCDSPLGFLAEGCSIAAQYLYQEQGLINFLPLVIVLAFMSISLQLIMRIIRYNCDFFPTLRTIGDLSQRTKEELNQLGEKVRLHFADDLELDDAVKVLKLKINQLNDSLRIGLFNKGVDLLFQTKNIKGFANQPICPANIKNLILYKANLLGPSESKTFENTSSETLTI